MAELEYASILAKNMRGSQKNKDYKAKWSPEIAYAVGLLTTDGSLSSDRRHLILVSKDILLLKTFKKCLGLKNKIGLRRSGYTGKKDCHHVQFGNVILYKWLLNIGLMPNKTKRIGILKIPNKYFFDFLRGHLDGDGYPQKYQDSVYPNSQRVYVHFHSASLKHLKWMQKRLKYFLNIKGYFRKIRNVYRLTFAKKESLKLLPKIYSNSDVLCLKRKYKIIQSLINKPRW